MLMQRQQRFKQRVIWTNDASRRSSASIPSIGILRVSFNLSLELGNYETIQDFANTCSKLNLYCMRRNSFSLLPRLPNVRL